MKLPIYSQTSTVAELKFRKELLSSVIRKHTHNILKIHVGLKLDWGL